MQSPKEASRGNLWRAAGPEGPISNSGSGSDEPQISRSHLDSNAAGNNGLHSLQVMEDCCIRFFILFTESVYECMGKQINSWHFVTTRCFFLSMTWCACVCMCMCVCRGDWLLESLPAPWPFHLQHFSLRRRSNHSPPSFLSSSSPLLFYSAWPPERHHCHGLQRQCESQSKCLFYGNGSQMLSPAPLEQAHISFAP